MEYSVLLADDKPENISQMVGFLREMGLSKNIYSAPNGKVAYTLAQKYRPNLILTDWDMPEMDGLALVKSIKSDPKTREIPVIMVTAVMTEPKRLREAFDAGVHDFLRKPYSHLEFLARVGNAIKLDNAYKEATYAREKLQRLNNLKDKIVSIISHDINEPLSSLSTLLNYTLKQILVLTPSEAQNYYSHINKQLNHAMTLLTNLLEWSRFQLQGTMVRVKVSVRPLVGEIFEQHTNKAIEKNIQLKNEIPADFEMYSDPNLLSFILRNLLVNALKFTQDGEVAVRAIKENDKVTFEVEDTGIGMSEERIEALFQNSRVTSRRGTQEEPGSGIGLALCNEYVQTYGGEMNVTSVPSKGSKFSFTIPF